MSLSCLFQIQTEQYPSRLSATRTYTLINFFAYIYQKVWLAPNVKGPWYNDEQDKPAPYSLKNLTFSAAC